MKKVLYIFIFFIIFIACNELFQDISRQKMRESSYNKALQVSKIAKKPLMVVGDPLGGKASQFYGPAYGCGDLCVDIAGCQTCRNNYKADILDVLKKEEDNSYVIYISFVLEYVDNIDETIEELYRVAGKNEHIFINAVQPYSLTAYFYKFQEDSSKRILTKYPPKDSTISYFNI